MNDQLNTILGRWEERIKNIEHRLQAPPDAAAYAARHTGAAVAQPPNRAQAEIEALRAQLESAQALVARSREEARSWKEKAAAVAGEYEKKINTAEHDRSAIKEQYGKKKAEEELLEEHARFVEAEIETVRKKNEQLIAEQQALKKIITEKDDELTRLFRQHDDMLKDYVKTKMDIQRLGLKEIFNKSLETEQSMENKPSRRPLARWLKRAMIIL
ncbi:MAG: hypothetical protein A2219_08440 [Elusimicrobia bacterium RIFOXYA2_FULL_50_26]|nr:MAG: hypothetical protein A2219_08440 [Elusimicrobia bacterium RIFOXYA2_FULL_50_26]